MDIRGKKINFLGDSITEGHGASSKENCFVSRIQKNDGTVCRNYGIGGTRIALKKGPSESPKHDLDFCSRVAEMESEADIIVVFGGTNDYGHGDAPLGEFSDRTQWTFYGALHTLYTSLIEKYPEAEIVVITPLHRLNEASGKECGEPLSRFVDAIREVAEYYSLPVLDLYKTSRLQPKVEIIRNKYMPDGLHPSDAGYEILARRISGFLKSL